MSDIRNLDLRATDGGVKVDTLMRRPVLLTAATANEAEYFGFFCNTSSGAWSYTPIDGKVAISFTPVAATYYPYHVSSITPNTGDVGFGNLGGFANHLVDAISTWTLTGTETVTNDILTVAIGDSSDLDAGSSVLPVVGHSYNYTYTITTFDSATKALMTYGGVDIYDEAVVGTYTGTITATAATGLEIDVDVVAVADFVMTGMQITRA
jgi:hypothetical protein